MRKTRSSLRECQVKSITSIYVLELWKFVLALACLCFCCTTIYNRIVFIRNPSLCVLRVQKMDCIDPHLSLELRLLLSGVLWSSKINSQCEDIGHKFALWKLLIDCVTRSTSSVNREKSCVRCPPPQNSSDDKLFTWNFAWILFHPIMMMFNSISSARIHWDGHRSKYMRGPVRQCLTECEKTSVRPNPVESLQRPCNKSWESFCGLATRKSNYFKHTFLQGETRKRI